MNYESRNHLDRNELICILKGIPEWLPSSPKNQKLLIWGEQGIGDQILYASMIDKNNFDPKNTTLAVNSKIYGISALVAGTITTTMVALVVAIPLGTLTAIYLSEFASHKVRETIKPILELLVGVPTVVFGYFALMLVTPFLQTIYPDLTTFNMLGPGIVMGIMIVPYIASVSEDAMRAVPMSMREGAYAMRYISISRAL